MAWASDRQLSLRPSDVAVALWLAHAPGARYLDLARALGLGVAEAHRGVRRLEGAGLLRADERRVNRQAFLELLVHGVRYVFPALLGPAAVGVPTAAAAPPLRGRLPAGPVVVWPWADGKTEGRALVPLYRAAPRAALADDYLYRTLALVDTLRLGELRERRLAQNLLDEEMSPAAT
jgi:DNA-binding Lrp family transcriptional regulator